MTWEPTTIPWEQRSEQEQKRLRRLWGSGRLRYKLDPSQREVYDDIRAKLPEVEAAADRTYVLDIGRQWGKDTVMSVLAVETLIRGTLDPKVKPRKVRIVYGAPTQEELRELLVPTMEMVFSDCPPELLPKEIERKTIQRSASQITWPVTESRLVLVGCDLHPNRLRGPATLAFFLTEPGFIRDLDNLVVSVLMPQLTTMPDGFGVMGSTPPVSPAHDWSQKYVPAHRANGRYAHRTIEDNPRVGERQREAMIRQAGGRDSTKSQREQFAMHVVEEELAIIPEFQAAKQDIVQEVHPPAFFDAYVALDPGWTHLCAGLFGFVDFQKQLLCIQDEFALARANTASVADVIREKEDKLWRNAPRWNGHGMVNQPYQRVSDTDLRMIGDLSREHGLVFRPTAKDNRDAQIANLRLWVHQRKLRIDPRCQNLIAHMEFGIWNKARTQFEESGDFGHFDLVAALVYLVRNVTMARNPNPPEGLVWDTYRMQSTGRAPVQSQSSQSLAGLFDRGSAKKRLEQRRK